MKRIVDPGHRYELTSLDGDFHQELTFVKREGDKFPGNKGHHPGTTMQSVIRCLIDRMRYLDRQTRIMRSWSVENKIIIFYLKSCLWLLEARAARRHKKAYFHGLLFAEKKIMCPHCGHTVCELEK